jgi:uncharacterized protein YaiL (DUF2058 family)
LPARVKRQFESFAGLKRQQYPAKVHRVESLAAEEQVGRVAVHNLHKRQRQRKKEKVTTATAATQVKLLRELAFNLSTKSPPVMTKLKSLP